MPPRCATICARMAAVVPYPVIPMPLENLLAYVAACIVLVAIPGPSVTLGHRQQPRPRGCAPD